MHSGAAGPDRRRRLKSLIRRLIQRLSRRHRRCDRDWRRSDRQQPHTFAAAAAFALFALGVAIYFALIRQVMRGPMLSQILSTFWLALLLRYTAFYIFSANFVSLPQTSLDGSVAVIAVMCPGLS
jgi:branched-subunit amino acid ABC-type transport system permease component